MESMTVYTTRSPNSEAMRKANKMYSLLIKWDIVAERQRKGVHALSI